MFAHDPLALRCSVCKGFNTLGYTFHYQPWILSHAHPDTANVYGDSEVFIGKWFKKTGKRSEIFLATKFGATASYGRGDPEYCKEQSARSLERLQTDYIDLYYLHR